MNRRLAVVVFGGLGRTGSVVVELIRGDRRFTLQGIVDTSADSNRQVAKNNVRTRAAQVEGGADVVIDFSLPAGTVEACRYCVEQECALVTGTTGLTRLQQRRLGSAAKRVPVVQAANMSLGANVVFALSRTLAELMPQETDIEIVEKHHRWKVDVPSGTSLQIAERLASAGSGRRRRRITVGRKAGVSPRTGGEICIHSLRGGERFGEHTIDLSWKNESLEITHRVHSRRAFARGAVEAAAAIVGRPPGFYALGELLAQSRR